MKHALAAALAVAFVTLARSSVPDDRAAVKLALKAKVRQAVAAPDGTLYLLEGALERYDAPVKPDNEPHRIVAWDLAKNREAGALENVPKGAMAMAVFEKKLVVACGQQGLAVIDLSTKAVSMIDVGKFAPYDLSPDSPKGKALAWGDHPQAGKILVEVDLETKKARSLSSVDYSGRCVYAAAGDTLVAQPIGGGNPLFYSLAPPKFQTARASLDRLPDPAARKGSTWGWRAPFANFKSVNGGANLLTTEPIGSLQSPERLDVVCFKGDLSTSLWTAEKHSVLAVAATKPLAVAIQHENDMKAASVTSWHLAGLHTGSGKSLWTTTVTFAAPIERTWNPDPSLHARTVVSDARGDHVVFAARDPKGKEEESWYVVDLPGGEISAAPVVEGVPPAVVRLSEIFRFTPRVSHAEKATFALAKAPEGMKIDSKTGAIEWTPGEKQVGTHAVTISAKAGGEEFPAVFSFEVRVTPSTEFAAAPCEFDAAQVVCSGDAVFVLEQKTKQGPPQSRIVVWDAAKKAVAKTITVPKSPDHMRLVNGRLVVACGASQVVAIIDPVEMKVVKSASIEIKGKALTPVSIHKEGPPGKALVSCAASDVGIALPLVEVDLTSGEVALLHYPIYINENQVFDKVKNRYVNVKTELSVVSVAFAKETLAWSPGQWAQGASGEITTIAAWRQTSPKNGQTAQLAPYPIENARSVNGGTNFASSTRANSTALLSPDWKQTLWTAEGYLVCVHPTKPELILADLRSMGITGFDTIVFRGVSSQTGKDLWKIALRLPAKVLANYTSFSDDGVCVRASKEGDELYFSFCGVADDYSSRRWFRAALPAGGADAGGSFSVANAPPKEVAVGENLEWTPEIKGTAPSAFVLKAAPDGMKVDAKTGKLSWKPDEGCVGKHDIRLVAKVGDAEIPVAAFELRVKPKR